MTVHGAKGLEFPIVIVSGMTTAASGRRSGAQVLFPPGGGCEIRLASELHTDQFELHKPVDEQMNFHEKMRLLYVACTRARSSRKSSFGMCGAASSMARLNTRRAAIISPRFL